MKRFILIALSLLLSFSIASCGNDKSENSKSEGANSQAPAQNESSNVGSPNGADTNERVPMPEYEKLGVNNRIATSDGRYIYYVYYDAETRNEVLCRADMNGDNEEILVNKNDPETVYIDDGYLYVARSKYLYKYDIATSPRFFGSSDLCFTTEDAESRQKMFAGYVNQSRTEGDYIYFVGSGIYRVKKDKSGLEDIAKDHPNGFCNVYNFNIVNDKLYFENNDDDDLYCMDLDGKNLTKIYENVGDYVIFQDSIYITDREKGTTNLIKTDLNGENPQIIYNYPEYMVLYNAMGDLLIYQSSDDEGLWLNSYNLKTGENKTICRLEDIRISDIDIVGDVLFVKYNCAYHIYGDGLTFKVNIDGSGYKLFGTSNTQLYPSES